MEQFCKFQNDPGAPSPLKCTLDWRMCDLKCACHFDARLGMLLERVEQAEAELDEVSKHLADSRADLSALLTVRTQLPAIETLPAAAAIAGAE